jgi:hypothetical protein
MHFKRFIFLFLILFFLMLNVGFSRTTVNHAPIAENDYYEGLRNNDLNVSAPGVLGNDSDEDGDSLTAVLDTNPINGTLSFNADGSFIYQPNGDWPYTDYDYDNFTYHVTDGSLNSNIAQVSIKVVNYPPVGNDDYYGTAPNQILNITAPGVMLNDLDGNGDVLEVMWVLEGPWHGYLTLNKDGSFTYEPEQGFVGDDWFRYTVSDGTMGDTAYDDAIATIAVSPDLPNAEPDSYQTDKNMVLNVAAPGVLANDWDPNGDPLSAIIDVWPTHGLFTWNPDGSFTYTPFVNYVGTDSFVYHVIDGVHYSNPATVNLTINDCVYCDDFNDGNLDPNWTYIKQFWSESNGSLIGTPSTRTAIAIARPIFAGCQTCSMEARMRSGGGAFNKVWMLAWYVDKKNTMELLMKEENDRWVLKQRLNGSVIAKANAIKTINPNTDYAVRITFDGISFNVFIDDFVTPLFLLTPQSNVPVGTIGFKVKNTIGSFDYVTIN